MDPTVCYDDLMTAIDDHQWEDAAELARNLWNWLANGGFPPARPPIEKDVPDVLEEPTAAGLRPFIAGINARLQADRSEGVKVSPRDLIKQAWPPALYSQHQHKEIRAFA